MNKLREGRVNKVINSEYYLHKRVPKSKLYYSGIVEKKEYDKILYSYSSRMPQMHSLLIKGAIYCG